MCVRVCGVAWLWTEMEGRRVEDGDGSDGSQGSVLKMMPRQGEPRDGFASYGYLRQKPGLPFVWFPLPKTKFINKI